MRQVLFSVLCVASSVGLCQGADSDTGFIYGRVTMADETVYEGRLRWGGDEEVLWNHYFYGVKAGNPWAKFVPQDALMVRRPMQFLGFEFGTRRQRMDLERPLLVRFGDLSHIEAKGRDLRVTFRSGRVIRLDRFEADDFADGLSIQTKRAGMVDIGEWSVRRVEFMAAPSGERDVRPLQGTVHTAQGAFTGLIQWDRVASLANDHLVGYAGSARVERRFEEIRAIERLEDGIRVLLRDGGNLEVRGTRATGDRHRGVYVDDARYGRVLVSWSAFRSAVFSLDGNRSAPGYDEFAIGRPLRGTVVSRDGRRLAGRIVFDLDESETIQTLDAPRDGVHYTLPFELVTSLDLAGGSDGPATVTLTNGEKLELSREDDLGPQNLGLLVFPGQNEAPEYLAWNEVAAISFEHS